MKVKNMYYHRTYGLYVMTFDKMSQYIKLGWNLGPYLNNIFKIRVVNNENL